MGSVDKGAAVNEDGYESILDYEVRLLSEGLCLIYTLGYCHDPINCGVNCDIYICVV